jgi:hypothetical protein
MAEAEKNNASPPIGKPHEVTIGISQAQVIELWRPIPHLLARGGGMMRAVVARLAPGRPPVYDYDAIATVAQELLQKGVDDYFERFAERLENECKARGIKVPKRSQMRKRFRPMFEAARARSAKH